MELSYKITEGIVLDIIRKYDDDYSKLSNEEREEVEEYLINAIIFLEKYPGEGEEITGTILEETNLPDSFKNKIENISEEFCDSTDDIDRVITCSKYVSAKRNVSNKLLAAYENEREGLGIINFSIEIDIKKYKDKIVSILNGINYGGDYGAIEFNDFKKIRFINDGKRVKYGFTDEELNKLFLVEKYPDPWEYNKVLSVDLTDSKLYNKLLKKFPDGIVKISVDGEVIICCFS